MEIQAEGSGGQGDVCCIVCKVYCIVVPELRKLSAGTMLKFRLGCQGVSVMYNALYAKCVALQFRNYGSLVPELCGSSGWGVRGSW